MVFIFSDNTDGVTMIDRRSSKRFPAKKKIRFGISEPKFLAHTLNISEEGAAIVSKNVFLPDTIVIVKLYAKSWFMVLDGIITWLLPDLSTNRYKMGIRFSKAIREFERHPVH
jgi:hypothetical protein